MTLGRGDGLLGMQPPEQVGPTRRQRDAERRSTGLTAPTVAPPGLRLHPLHSGRPRLPRCRNCSTPVAPCCACSATMAAEADAMDRVLGPGPDACGRQQAAVAPPRHRQQPGPGVDAGAGAHFGDFWADVVPPLRAEGWSVVGTPALHAVPCSAGSWSLAPDATHWRAAGQRWMAR